MRRSFGTRLGVTATAVAVGAVLASGTSAAAVPAPGPGPGPGVKVTCDQFTICGWTGINFSGLKGGRGEVQPGDCMSLPISARSAINYTYQIQRLYTGVRCTGTSYDLSPGESASNMGAARRYVGGY